jgi:3-hydroxyisobutyrate dehydrogenase
MATASGSKVRISNIVSVTARRALEQDGLVAGRLAEKIGVDTKSMLDILVGTSAGSWMLKDRGPRMLQADPEVTSAVDIFVKDLGIVLEAGRETKAALPMTALAYQLFNSTSGRGEGTADDSQVIRAYRALNGTT